MIQKTTASLALLLVIASCDKKQNQSAPGSNPEPGQRTTHSDRASRNTPGTRDQFRTALDEAKAKEPAEEREKAIAALVWKCLDSAPDLAAKAILELPSGNPEKEALIQAHAETLARDNPEVAVEWANSLSEERERLIAREQVALILTPTDPKRALNLLPNSGFAAAAVNPMAEQILQTWTTKNPAEAVDWVARLPATGGRGAGLETVLSQWVQTDPGSAFRWSASQGNRQIREEAVHTMAATLFNQLESIRDDQLKDADPKLRTEIEQGIAEIARQARTAEPEPLPEPEPAPEPEMKPETQPETVPEPQAEPEPEMTPEPEPEESE